MASSSQPPSEVQQHQVQPRAQAKSFAPGGLRVALGQIAPTLGNVARNFDLHLAQIEQARQQGADLIVFPELSLTGYFLRDMVPEVALPRDSVQLQTLAEAAGPMDLVVGFVEEGPGHRFYNAAAYFQGGWLRHVHRKVYLPTYGLFDEARYFAHGERICAFDTAQFGRVGLLVCEDFWHLSTVAVLQADGIDLLICIANSPARGVAGENVATAETYDRLCRAYAQLLGAMVILVNRVGFEDGLCFWGGSTLTAPNGEHVAQAPMLDEHLLLAALDPAEVRRQRLISPLGRDERLLVTLEELKRIKRARYATE